MSVHERVRCARYVGLITMVAVCGLAAAFPMDANGYERSSGCRWRWSRRLLALGRNIRVFAPTSVLFEMCCTGASPLRLPTHQAGILLQSHKMFIRSINRTASQQRVAGWSTSARLAKT